MLPWGSEPIVWLSPSQTQFLALKVQGKVLSCGEGGGRGEKRRLEERKASPESWVCLEG